MKLKYQKGVSFLAHPVHAVLLTDSRHDNGRKFWRSAHL